jgi:Ser/Thr protein kinase RdoA (MazF antagonist)
MHAAEVRRALAAARSTVTSLGLTANDATVLSNSNRVVLRLLPCDAVARVAPVAHQNAVFEVELAQRLVEAGGPLAALDPRVAPRVHERDGFVVTLWTYYEPMTSRKVSAADDADALERLHGGMRAVDVDSPHVTDRVDEAMRLVGSRDLSPELGNADRELLGDTLSSRRRVVVERGGEQLLHGEPHPGNLLATKDGLLFVDLETCCRGPVEFDLAHAPDEVSAHYPGLDSDVLRACRILMLAMIISWRFERDDQLPDGRRRAAEWLGQLRALLDHDEGNQLPGS